MNLETEIYQILKKHKLTLKKREEVIVDLLVLIKADQAEQLILSGVGNWVRFKALNFIKMKNRGEVKVTPELLNNTKVNDEYLFRELARKMVSDIPLEELHKLINLNKIDPNSDESEKVLSESIDRFEIEQIHQLRNDRVILYSAKVDLP